ncbi:tRNA modification GTPase [Candidatus Cyrtobacter comes]|uniref:tRNA modification GTPase MnmE n=1 Tax=Candidatus Cyrtobacter comes TaxID=675776 RepID=A0ABU5L6Z7_9RICK|nr:tRNA modification GTPase [Candidatus Cyrtobacter comes]
MIDTIFALSTVYGKSGIAIIRVCGPKASNVARLLGIKRELPVRQAFIHQIRTIDDTEFLDNAMVLFFKKPNSFNGEDILELHLHGSIAVIDGVLDELSKISYIRLAEPGEFAKIAFLNEIIDLTEAEGMADLIDAETSMQRAAALKQMAGEAGNLCKRWREGLVKILSNLEALIDFPEEDLPTSLLLKINEDVGRILEDMDRNLSISKLASSVAAGIRVVISGPPNAGKSSLMNLIAKSDVSIVSDIAGTTRDVVSIRMNLDGFLVNLYDTAGIRDSEDLIEKEGIKRAKLAIQDADINILVLDICGNDVPYVDIPYEIVVLNKLDIAPFKTQQLDILAEKFTDSIVLTTSVKNAHGLDDLLTSLIKIIRDKYQLAVHQPSLSRLRQREKLRECISYLRDFMVSDGCLDILCENIRNACRSIGAITGNIDIEEILDEIFSNFCIGK